MNCSDAVRDIRRFALARNSEVHVESPNYVKTTIGFKNAFLKLYATIAPSTCSIKHVIFNQHLLLSCTPVTQKVDQKLTSY